MLPQIVAVTLTVRHHITSKAEFESIKAIKFITTYLLPPPKKAVLAYLGIPLAPGEKAEPPAKIVRRAEVDVSTYQGLAGFDSILAVP